MYEIWGLGLGRVFRDLGRGSVSRWDGGDEGEDKGMRE